jgi:ABC-type Fe3+/spermidine/putrescine transport system ATPase subunit
VHAHALPRIDKQRSVRSGKWLLQSNPCASSCSFASMAPSSLQRISGRFSPGKLIGILGGSGSGKTTLLNLLANRGGIRETSSCMGKILFNGKSAAEYGRDTTSIYDAASNADASSAAAAASHDSHQVNPLLANRIGYVLQQEFLLPHLTVFETLDYAARLRLSRTLSVEEKRDRVEEIIRELNLKGVRDSLIGDEIVRGIRSTYALAEWAVCWRVCVRSPLTQCSFVPLWWLICLCLSVVVRSVASPSPYRC